MRGIYTHVYITHTIYAEIYKNIQKYTTDTDTYKFITKIHKTVETTLKQYYFKNTSFMTRNGLSMTKIDLSCQKLNFHVKN